jgi:vacuolar-type H+-ATPase subunit E/Vma4
MSREDLKRRVLDRARAESDAALAEAGKKADGILAAARDRAGRAASETRAAAERASAEARRRALSAAERDSRLAVLEMKNRVIDEALSRAAEQLRSKDMGEVFRRELAGTDLEGAVVKTPPGRAAALRAVAPAGTKVEEDAAVASGYVVEGPGFRLVRTIEARIEDARAALRSELAALLFGEVG